MTTGDVTRAQARALLASARERGECRGLWPDGEHGHAEADRERRGAPVIAAEPRGRLWGGGWPRVQKGRCGACGAQRTT